MSASQRNEFQKALRELRKQYLEHLRETIGRLRDLLRSVEQGADQEALRELRDTFHKLAGGGAVYGVPAVSDLGLKAEEYLTEILESSDETPPEALAHVSSWIEDLERIRAEAASA